MKQLYKKSNEVSIYPNIYFYSLLMTLHYLEKSGNKYIPGTLATFDHNKLFGNAVNRECFLFYKLCLSLKTAQPTQRICYEKIIGTNLYSILKQMLVRPHLKYYSLFCSPYLRYDVVALETALRKSTGLIVGMRRLSYRERPDWLDL